MWAKKFLCAGRYKIAPVPIRFQKKIEVEFQAIEIKEEEEIIMAEWARGEFVKRWTDMASREGNKIIFVQNRRP